MGANLTSLEKCNKILKAILEELEVLNLTPLEYFKTKNNKIDMTEFRYKLRQINIVPSIDKI